MAAKLAQCLALRFTHQQHARNGAGSVTGAYTYDAFGAVRAHTGASTQWSFTGEQNDANGLVYLRARHYDPAIGRFLTRDPFGGFTVSPQSLNRYLYVANRPVHLVDPWGLCGISSWGDFGDCFRKPAKAVGGRLGQEWEEFKRDISDPSVWKPLAGAAIIFVADAPAVTLDVGCFFTFFTGVTCVAADAYSVFVATPATAFGLCLAFEEDFGIPGWKQACSHERNHGKE